jgi:hypothetical protein
MVLNIGLNVSFGDMQDQKGTWKKARNLIAESLCNK